MKKIHVLEEELKICPEVLEKIIQFNEQFNPDRLEEHLRRCDISELLIPIYKAQYTKLFNTVYSIANIPSRKKSSL